MSTQNVRLTPPWGRNIVRALNRYQAGGWMHPFTCGSGNRTDSNHLDGQGKLVATESGWICPFCEYTQDWAHSFMLEGPPAWHKATEALEENKERQAFAKLLELQIRIQYRFEQREPYSGAWRAQWEVVCEIFKSVLPI